jgi:septum site-determining protein MinD
VTTPEVSAVRDADRIIGMLAANGIEKPLLILNRLRPDMVKKNQMMSVEDVNEILAIDVLGVVPDDEAIIISTNKGIPVVADKDSQSGQAYRNIVQRLLGNSTPIMDFETKEKNSGFTKALKNFFKLG